MEINRKELLKALIAIKPGLISKETVEQSSCVVFLNNWIHTYNDEIYICYPYDIDLKGAVGGQELFSLLNKVSEETLQLIVKENELLVEGEKFKSSLNLQTGILLPFGEIEDPEEWNTLPEDFCESLKFCSFSVGKSLEQPILTCIHCNKDKMESADSYRFTRKKWEHLYFKESLLIPGKSIIPLININPVYYSKVNGWVWFKNENDVLLSCRTYNLEYVDLDKYIEVKGSKIKFPKETIDIIDKASIFSKDPIEGNSNISLVVEKGLLTISSKSHRGTYEEKVRIRHQGNNFQVKINPEFLKSILSKASHSCVVDDTKMKFEEENSIIHVIRIISKKDQVPF